MRSVGAFGPMAVKLEVDRIKAKSEVARHRCALAFGEHDGVERATGGPPTAFRIWSAGKVVTDHGTHELTQESVKLLLEDQATRGNRFSIDVDHMSLSDNAPPANHKAVGWFSIEERNGDLWAVNVEWTDDVRDGFTKSPPEWRYFSPAYETTKKGGEIVRLLNMALTNNPATHRVTALATTATTKEKAAMADEDKDEKKEETLGQMIAAFEAEPDEEKRAAMKDAIRAKYKAAFGEDDDKKEEPKKEEKKTAKASEVSDEKEAEKCAASIADNALAMFETARKAKEEAAEKERILAKLPAGEREDYKDLSLDQVKRVVGRHHKEALAAFTATTTAAPTLGSNVTHAAMGGDESRRLDRLMGLEGERPIVTRDDSGKLTFHGGSPQQAKRFLASIAKEQEKGASNAEALNRVFATQSGGMR